MEAKVGRSHLANMTPAFSVIFCDWMKPECEHLLGSLGDSEWPSSCDWFHHPCASDAFQRGLPPV